jgi:acyl-coenzyme A synthetase/AMP-(fatty) acid ligase
MLLAASLTCSGAFPAHVNRRSRRAAGAGSTRATRRTSDRVGRSGGLALGAWLAPAWAMAGPPPALANFGVGTWIERRARIAPDRVALIGDGRVLSYAALARRIRLLANALHGLGVGRGDRVAWLGPNHPAFLESLFAAGLVGAALAPVNHRLPVGQIRALLDDTEPSVLLQHGPIYPDAVPGGVRHRIAVTDATEGAATDRAVDFEALLAASHDDPVDVAVGLHDVCLLPHTSGTTGPPKGVMFTHGNLTWNVVNFLSCADFRGDDITVAIAPFFRVGGTGVNVLPVLFLVGQVVVTARSEPQPHPAADAAPPGDRGFRQPRSAGRPDPLPGLATRRPAAASWSPAALRCPNG